MSMHVCSFSHGVHRCGSTSTEEDEGGGGWCVFWWYSLNVAACGTAQDFLCPCRQMARCLAARGGLLAGFLFFPSVEVHRFVVQGSECDRALSASSLNLFFFFILMFHTFVSGKKFFLIRLPSDASCSQAVLYMRRVIPTLATNLLCPFESTRWP